MTYLLLSAVFVGIAAVVAALTWRMAPRGHLAAMLITAAVLAVLTAVFDTVMIATGLFAYSDAGVLLLAGLWNLVARRPTDTARMPEKGRPDAD